MHLPHEVPDTAGRNQLLLQRAEQAAWLVLSGLPIFYVVDRLQGATLFGPLAQLKTLAAGLAWTTIYVARREALLAWARLIALQAFAAFCFITAASGIISQDALTTPMLCSTVTFSAAVLFPWGGHAQGGAIVVAAAAIAWNRLHVTGSFGTDAAYPLTAVAIAMVASLAWAAAAERQLARDNQRTYARWAPQRRTMRDLVGVMFLAATTYVLVSTLESFEMLDAWTPDHRHRHLTATVLAVMLGLAMLWFAYRRMRETATELEARWQVEKTLAEVEAWFQAAVDSSKVGVWDWDLQTGETHYSESWRTLFGYTPAELDGSMKAWAKIVHPDDLERLAGSTSAATAITDPAAHYAEEFRLRHKDGTYRWVLSRATVFRDAAGTPQRMVGAHVDITERKRAQDAARVAERTRELESLNEDLRRENAERKRAEAALRESEDRYRDLVENSQDLICTHDLEGNLLSVNEAAVRVTAYSRDSLLRMNLADLLGPGLRTELAAYLAEIRDRGRARGIMRIQTASGEPRVWEYDNTLRAEGAAVSIVRGMAHDITDRWRAEQQRRALEAQLRVAQKMDALGTLAGGIAHDFNNILAAIIGNTELARRNVGPSHPAAENLQEIRKASQRAKGLVQRILTFGRQHQQPQSVIALRSVVEDAVALLRPTLPAGVELTTAFDADAPTVLADPTQIHQVLINLCTNAWHAMEGHADRIDIRLDGITLDAEAARVDPTLRPGHFARLSVTDTGAGMDAATLERIFEPFFTTKPVGQGVGLGLSVVHGIVKAHGGAITVTSQPGSGTTFSLYFPAAEAPEQPAAPEVAAPKPLPAAGGQHVLYLDDEEGLVSLVTRLLELLGYRVSGYTRPEEALAAVRADPGQFDLVVTDLNMPGMSGLDVARALSRLRPDLPVVLVSGYITDELRGAALEAGVRELIYKPNTFEELGEVVQRLAGEPKHS